MLEDCTGGLDRPTADALAFMARFYGAEIAPSSEWAGGPAAAAADRTAAGDPQAAPRL